MNTKRIYSIITVLLLFMAGMQAQEANKLYIPDTDAIGGKEFQLPVCIDNQNPCVTAMQFTVKVPEGIDATRWKSGTTTERLSSTHRIAASKGKDGKWTFLVYSPDNAPISGSEGAVIQLPTVVADSISEGSTLQLQLSDVVLSDSLGNNVLTGYDCGAVNVLKTPDFAVGAVGCDVSHAAPLDSITVSWTVKNIGGISATGGWSERVYLISESGEELNILHSSAHEARLAAGADTVRTVGVRLPKVPGIGGETRVRVIVTPDADSGERDINLENNTAEGENILTIAKRLYVTMPERMEMPEGKGTFNVRVERSGSTAEALPLTISKEGDERVTLPEEDFVIPAGRSYASFRAGLNGDILTTADSIFSISAGAEGYDDAAAQIILYYTVPPTAQLVCSTQKIVTTAQKDGYRDYPIVIRNKGRQETGKITLALPEWMKPMTGREMPSLAYGDSATILLRITLLESMKVGVPVEGYMGINSENANGVRVNFSITPVSEKKGRLKVDVVDEFTFNTAEAPHVAGAKAELRRSTTGETVATATSDAEGHVQFEVEEGQYVLAVTAEGHEDFSGSITVDPGVEKSREVFVSCDNVSYSFTVVPTEVEDEYALETVVKYDVRVPKPVLIVKMGIDERPQVGDTIPITVTNMGWINAVDVGLVLASSNPTYNIEFLYREPHLDTLAAKQTEVFYARLTSNAGGAKGVMDKPSAYECERIGAKMSGYYLCGDYYSNPVSGEDERLYGECFGSARGGWPVYSSWGGYYGGDGWGNSPVDSGWWQSGDGDYLQKICDKRFPYDPTNPNNPNAPNDPIDLGTLPEGEPGRIDCDEDNETAIFMYKLIPTEGTRYIVKGVAADGKAQVKIALDPESKIPEEDCEKYEFDKWYLKQDPEGRDSVKWGKIKGSSFEDATYTAPGIFSSQSGSSVTVQAIMKYIYRSKELTDVREVPVEIEIIRAPVVFVHGLGDSDTCWYNLDKTLVHRNYYKPDINYRADYKKTNTSAFFRNVPVVYSSLLKARRRALAQGYVAQKCDIVGHSMGGILTRLFLQEGGDRDLVNRFITVNTPHAGSEFGDAVMAHPVVIGALAMLNFKGLDLKRLLLENLDAVRDLAVESDAIKHLNSVVGSESGIDVPVYALATESNLDWLTNALWRGADEASSALITKGKHPIAIGIGLIAKYFTHFFSDDLSQIGKGDMIVSTQSQQGNCKASSVIRDGLTGGPWHVNSPSDGKVINKVSDLLTKGSSEEFSTDWFNPTERHFDHSLWLLKEGADLAMEFLPEDEFCDKFKNLYESMQDMLDIATELQTNGQSKGTRALARSINDDNDTGTGGRNTVNVTLQPSDTYSEPGIIVSFGDDGYYMIEGYEADCEVPSTFSGKAYVYVSVKGEDGNLYITGDSVTIERPLATPVSISTEDTFTEVGGEESLRLHCTWSDGTETQPVAESVTFETDGIATYSNGYISGLTKGRTDAVVSYGGLTCPAVVRVFSNANADDNSSSDDDDDDDEQSDNVCSTVTLSFKQNMVMTRQAFRGTLTVNNGNKTSPLRNVKVHLDVRDEAGKAATSHEFQINAESLKGFEGDTTLTSGWTLRGDETGVVTILFIPTKYAAPEVDTPWSFGGSFSYTDPSTGLIVTHDLTPVTLTVKPSPNLRMDYFMQRDVMGDDPLTDDVTEPMVPAEFSLLINNTGNGDATNVRMVTHQPEIIDNEKGLLIDFDLLSSQLNGGEKTLALGESVATEFGTIPANSATYAQWWFTSTLLGHFSEYDVTATHVSSYGNPDLSLLDTVRVHELIHGFTVRTDGDKSLRGFLVNDIKDKDDLPDEVYFTDGTQQGVSIATGAETRKQSATEYVLTVNASSEGWNYGSLPDPTNGRQELAKVTRADGTEVNADNIWQTACTLRDGKDPLYEKRLHFVGNMSADGETFYLTFGPKTELELEVVASPSEGGTVTPDGGSFNNGSDVTLNGVAAEGYHFVKWSNGETANPYVLTMNEDTSLIAEFVPNIYAMTFVLDNGEENVVKTQDYASELSAPAEPTKTGFTFKGWSPEVPAAVPASDQTFTAQWERNSYKLTWDVDGVKSESQVLYEAYITMPADPSKEGYTFAEWTPDVAETMPAEDVTYTANWTVNQYSMTFVLDNGEENVVKTQDYASELTSPADPTKTGFTFKGWSPEVPASVPDGDITFTAQWERNSYTMKFVVDGVTVKEESIPYESAVTKQEDPTKEHYSFTGWEPNVPESMPANDVTCTAQFQINQHTMTFVLDNGDENVVKTQDYASDLSSPTDPTKTGFIFQGWSPEVPATVPASDQTFTAQWERNSYKLTWDIDGVKTESQVLYEASITKPADPSKEGYTFTGWLPDVPRTMPAEDMTFTAQFEANVYTIIYVVNGEEWQRETMTYGEPIVLREYPMESGVEFSGWTSDADYKTMPAHDVTYSASATTGIASLKEGSQLVDVFDLRGRMVLSRVPVSRLSRELPNGIYIINGNKVRIAK